MRRPSAPRSAPNSSRSPPASGSTTPSNAPRARSPTSRANPTVELVVSRRVQPEAPGLDPVAARGLDHVTLSRRDRKVSSRITRRGASGELERLVQLGSVAFESPRPGLRDLGRGAGRARVATFVQGVRGSGEWSRETSINHAVEGDQARTDMRIQPQAMRSSKRSTRPGRLRRQRLGRVRVRISACPVTRSRSRVSPAKPSLSGVAMRRPASSWSWRLDGSNASTRS
jgi:hypothetical protein